MDALTKAYMSVKDNSMPIKKAARLNGVPETTLRKRISGAVDVDCVKSGPNPMFTLEQEARLVDHVTMLAKVGYGYTRGELCSLATEYAIDLELRSRDNPLSLQWYRSFIQRWPNLAVKKPRTLSLARAKATSEDAVNSYFLELDKILTKYSLKDKPQYIYNIDEKGISDNHNPPKIVTDKYLTPMAVTSGMSSTVTVLGAGNALGTCIPPFFVFPGKRMRSELLEGATAGASGTVSESGWSNGEIFRHYLQEHFLNYVQGRNETQPILLLYDGHRSHVSLTIIEWANSQNIILFVLPPHTSHVLQPLDVGCFGPFQKIYDNLRHKFMRSNISSGIPKHVVCELACKAYSLSVTPNNLTSSFRKCGIHPFNPLAVSRDSFLPSTVFKQSSPVDTGTENKPADDTPLESASAKSVASLLPEPVSENDSEAVPVQEHVTEPKCVEGESSLKSPLNPTVRFFRDKEGVLFSKQHITKKRRVLSAVVGGKPISEQVVSEKIKKAH